MSEKSELNGDSPPAVQPEKPGPRQVSERLDRALNPDADGQYDPDDPEQVARFLLKQVADDLPVRTNEQIHVLNKLLHLHLRGKIRDVRLTSELLKDKSWKACLKLEPALRNILVEQFPDIETLEQLGKLTIRQLQDLKGVGKQRLENLKKQMEDNGFPLKP